MKGSQTWVTYAGSDQDGVKALVLARSLRRTITTRPLAIFVSTEVSDHIWELLEDEFDRCIKVDKKGRKNGSAFPTLPFTSLAKLLCWRLARMKKFAFLDCNLLVLQNSDNIFKKIGLERKGKGRDLQGISLIVDSPSDAKFRKIAGNLAGNESLKDTFNLDLEDFGTFLLQSSYNAVPCSVNKINMVFYAGGKHPVDILMGNNNTPVDPKSCSIFEDGNPFEMGLHQLFLEIMASFKTKPGTFKLGEYLRLKDNPKIVGELDEIIDKGIPFTELEDLKDSIAIVGMGLRFPGANNLEEFWDLLINGRDGIIRVPDTRWTEDQCFNRSETTKETHAGFLKCPIDEIDGKFFGLSPAEVSYMDPQQRLTLQVIWETLEHAGINPGSLKNSLTGVFGGWWRNDYKEMLQDGGLNEQEFFRTYMGNALGTITGRISHLLELTGPSVSTESGCSTSIVAVDMACKSLSNEDCDLALAFGVNLLLHPFGVHTMNSVIALDGHCKTFDAKADGFGRAEGCGVLALKRFPDAVKDGDRIWGLIRGSAVVQEGPSRSLGTPTKQCEALAMTLALEDAGVEPHEISFVETHGTGTPVGDPLEVAALAEVYSKDRVDKLVIGSVKTNIGHTESCSGIAGIIKTILSLEHEMIPPHKNFQVLNPDVNLEAIPALIPLQSLPWKKASNGKPRIAGVSSFGITGTDAHVIIQETPKLPPPLFSPASTPPIHFLKASAKSSEGLTDLLSSYKKYLEKTEEALQDVCFSGNSGRGDFAFRTSVIGSSKAELIKNLGKKPSSADPCPNKMPELCFLFTGQGSQYPGMAKSLYDHSPVFKSHFNLCANILLDKFQINIQEAIWGTNSLSLSHTLYSQTSIFAVEYALLKVWESWGVRPSCVLGHSLGEFTAATAAGILTLEDAITLVATRSKLIDDLPPGKMMVIKASKKATEDLLQKAFTGSNKTKWLDFAAMNSEDQTVLAGIEGNIEEFKELCSNNNIKTHVLESTHAFHSRLMEPMLAKYKDTASKLTYKPSTCTYISGMDGKIVESTELEINPTYWVRHTKEPVNFIRATKAALELSGSTLFLEIGPQPVLSALVLHNVDSLSIEVSISCVPSLRRSEDPWITMLTSLGTLYTSGVEVDWDSYHGLLPGNKITLPYYPFKNKSHWFDLKGERQRLIHPLVGSSLPNPTQLTMFTNSVDLVQLAYLKDHAIGNTIVFPGAGFLEICLMAGHAAGQQLDTGHCPPPSAPITLEDFVITAPLALSDQYRIPIQSVVSIEDTGETRVTIYSKLVLDQETHKWISHASARFSPYAVEASGQYSNDTLQGVRSRCTVNADTGARYERFAEMGLKFGPTFQTLTTVHKTRDAREVYFTVKIQAKVSQEYVCHPTVLDAMFQALAISTNPDSNSLHVPISVSKFIWYSKMKTDTGFVHARQIQEGTGPAEYMTTLYDLNGQKIAIMIGAALLETTVGSVITTIEAQRTSLPNMFQETWKETLGHYEKRLSTEPHCQDVYSEEFHKKNEKSHELDELGTRLFKQSRDLCAYYFIKALYDLGWSPGTAPFAITDLITSLKVQQSFFRFVQYFLKQLVQDGFLEFGTTSGVFKPLGTLPNRERVISLIASLDNSSREVIPEVECIIKIGSHIADVLTGKQSILSLLFPDDPTEKSSVADQYYLKSEFGKNILEISKAALPAVFNPYNEEVNETKSVLRILEVGAGTGSFTRAVVPYLTSPCEYTYTDISPTFFRMGEKVFEDSKIPVIYKTLDIEEDPTSQGFVPHYYDIVLVFTVIHATKDIRQSLANLRNLIRPRGCLILVELTQPHRVTNLIFGMVDGFWKFTDHDLRPDGCEMSMDKWEMVLKESDFPKLQPVNCYDYNGGIIIAEASPSFTFIHKYFNQNSRKGWILFTEEEPSDSFLYRKLEEVGVHVFAVRRSTTGAFCRIGAQQFEICPQQPSHMQLVLEEVMAGNKKSLEGIIYLWGLEQAGEESYETARPFLTLCKVVGGLGLEQVKFLVFTQGIFSMGDTEVALPFGGILWAMTKAFKNENPFLQCKCIDLDPDADIPMEKGFSELFINDGEHSVAYRNNQRRIARFLQLKLPNTRLAFPKSDRFHLILPSSKAIQDLRFGPVDKPPLESNEVEIKVKAFGLNFRDVLIVLKPDSMFDNWNTVGVDFTGEVAAVGTGVSMHKVGDAVFGTNLDGDALPSFIKAPEDLICPLPKGMTFCEGATLPAVLSTVFLCLIDKQRLERNSTILIHTGSGGVGLCAIQVAQSLNCRIVSTAGSARKRQYLRSLGIQHVFNSRNTSYEEDIKKSLGGAEVDFVLNSLTGPGFKEASLAVCKRGAKFIEMSKLNIWTEDQVRSLRPDIKYEIVDLSASNQDKIKEYCQEVGKYIDKDTVRSLPYVRFDAGDIREALTFMQKAKHIGKVVCVMPEPRDKQNITTDSDVVSPLFNSRSTYLITGGLGGIGMEVTKWMACSGAKHIVLVGRNPPGEKAALEINRLRSAGTNVLSMECDVGDLEKCRKLLERLKDERSGLPPLRGIMHSAGVLSDASYENQSWDKYEETFNPKVKGGWNLHKLTLDYRLEQFLVFSSASSNFGSLGQSNHSAANMFLDSLVTYRNSIGLPGKTVNWGQWGQVGVAANLDLIGMKPFSTLQGISALDRILRNQIPQVCVLEANFNIIRRAFPMSQKYLEDFKEGMDDRIELLKLNSQDFWREYDTMDDYDGRCEAVKKYIRLVVRQVLKLDENDVIDDNANLQDTGMDSLMMIETKNVLQSLIGDRAKITVNAVKDCSTVTQLATCLVSLVSGGETRPPPTREELLELIAQDSILPSHIKPESFELSASPAEISCLLITGVTGNLGPYILREVTNRAQIKKVYCLIRGRSKTLTPEARLRQLLQERDLLTEIQMTKVYCIAGNVIQERLGLTEDLYNRLGSEVDGVIHLAVKSSWQEIYQKNPLASPELDIRQVNVFGTRNVLEFACHRKAKQFMHASALLAVSRLDPEGESIMETWPQSTDFEQLPNDAYPISKLVSERLVGEAGERGLPCKVFRFPFIGGDSKTGGNISVLNNALLLRMMSYLHLGIMPAYPIPFNMIPVDQCADFAGHLFFNPNIPNDVFNLTNPRENDEQELEDFSQEIFDRNVEIVEPDDFREKVRNMEDSELLIFIKRGAANEETRRNLEDNTPDVGKAWLTKTSTRVFCSKKLETLLESYPQCLEPSIDILKRDLMFAKSSGIFTKLGV